MAVGKLDIVNLALMRIGESPIQSMDEGSTPARSATLLYDLSRRAVLRDYDWSFAIKMEHVPVEHSDEPGDKLSYSGALPADCLRVVEVLPYEGVGPLIIDDAVGVPPGLIRSSPFRSEFFRVYNGKIYTHLKHPIVKYVRDEVSSPTCVRLRYGHLNN